ncbi:MAG: MBL fold metallo-hydrolase, partial [Micrococcaceae bacterium]|nr:MBL fold metallo-hydrolase [Micrococcaceae bacterium]
DRTAGVHVYARREGVDQLRAHPALGAAGDRIHGRAPDDVRQIAGFDVRVFGGQHALIHPQIPVVANLGYLVDGNLYHPGDSFIVPNGVTVQTLLVPLHAPWSKLAEVVDFVVSVRPAHAYPIHDGLLNERGLGMMTGHVTRFGARYGTEFEYLQVGESREA